MVKSMHKMILVCNLRVYCGSGCNDVDDMYLLYIAIVMFCIPQLKRVNIRSLGIDVAH